MYTQTDYEAFAAQTAATLRITNKPLAFDAPSPQVTPDGQVHLPAFPPNQSHSPEQFTNTCAAIIHELAHVYYRSHTEHTRQNQARQDTLFNQCFNACLDVADETGIEKPPSPLPADSTRHLLLKSNLFYARKPELKDSSYALHWRILAMGIIKTRAMTHKVRNARTLGRTLTYENPQVQVQEVFRLLRLCRLQSRLPGKHARLVKYADAIANLLRPAHNPTDPIPAHYANPLADALSEGSNPVNAQTDADDSPVPNPHGTLGGNPYTGPDQFAHDKSPQQTTYDMFLPIAKRITSRIAVDGDQIDREESLKSGSYFADFTRAYTDGACFGRYQDSEHAEGMALAILLDVSISMRKQIQDVAGIARAFADAAKDCAQVHCYTFGVWTQKSADCFHSIPPLQYGTETHDAITTAYQTLKPSSAGRKYIICLTDGAPDRPTATIKAIQAAHDDNIRVIAIDLLAEHNLNNSMRGATIVSAPDIHRLAIQLANITNQL